MSTIIIYTLETDKGKCQTIAADMDGVQRTANGSWRQQMTKVRRPNLECVRTESPKRYDFNVDNLFGQVGQSERFIWVGHGSKGRLRSTDYGQNTQGNINLDSIARLIALTNATKIHINACNIGFQYPQATDNKWNQQFALRYLATNIAQQRENATFLLTGTAASVMLNVGSSIDMVFNPKYGHPYYKYENGSLVASTEEQA